MTDKYDRYRMWGCSGLVDELERSKRENQIANLCGERNAYRRIKAMQVDGWLKKKCDSEIKRITEIIKTIENSYE